MPENQHYFTYNNVNIYKRAVTLNWQCPKEITKAIIPTNFQDVSVENVAYSVLNLENYFSSTYKRTLEIIKTYSVTQFYDDWMEKLASRVFTTCSTEQIKDIIQKQNQVFPALGHCTFPGNHLFIFKIKCLYYVQIFWGVMIWTKL